MSKNPIVPPQTWKANVNPSGPSPVDRNPQGDDEFRLRSFLERYVIEARSTMPAGVDEVAFIYSVAQNAREVYRGIGRMAREHAPSEKELRQAHEREQLLKRDGT